MAVRLVSVLEQPLSIDAVKLHLRVDHDDEDALLATLIGAASDLAGQYTGQSVARCELELLLSRMPSGLLRLPRGPVVSVESVRVGDTNGADFPDFYDVRELGGGWGLVPGEAGWPSGPAVIQYTAGYGLQCPAAIQQWMLLQIGHWYRNRESVAVSALVSPLPYVDSLLDRYRVWGE